MTVQQMKYGNLEGLDKPVSRLIQGTMMISTAEQEKSNALLDAVMAHGGNTFDCAWVYGGNDAERGVGNWMKERGNRDEVVILTKGAHHNDDRKKVTPFDISADLHDSLARLKTDYIDLYLLHRDDPDVPVGPIVDRLNELQKEGKIKLFGGSNWTTQRIAAANAYAAETGQNGFAVSSPNFSLAEQIKSPWGSDCVTLSGPAHAEDRAWYAQEKMPVMTWSSMARGFFSGRWNRENYQGMAADGDDATSIHAYCYESNFQRLDRVEELSKAKGFSVAQIALAWVLAQKEMDIYALIGCLKAEEHIQCVDAGALELTPEECEYLNLERESL